MVPSYGPFETKQLLSEKFFSPWLDFRDIRLDVLKWSTLYIYIYIYMKYHKLDFGGASNLKTSATFGFG